MKNFYNAISPNKVWILALVVIMAACSQFEAIDPDKATLEQSSEELAAINVLSPDLWNARLADCDGPTAEPRTDLIGSGGNVECSQAGEYDFSSGRVDFDGVNGTFDNDGNWPEGFTIHTDGTYVSWEFTPFVKDGVLQCLKDLSVIVKGGPAANVYTYSDGETSDCNLASPDNASGGPAGLSNLTLCYNLEPCPDDEPCYEWIGETAWSAGTRYVNRGSWATWSTKSALEHGVTLFAGQTMDAGTVKLKDGVITITLNEGWRFAETDENVKIQSYSTTPPAENPRIGRFETKGTAKESPFNIDVKEGAYYGVHVDVEEYREVECPVED